MDNYLLDLMICRIPGLKGDERIKLVKKFDSLEDFCLLSKSDLENTVERLFKDSSWSMADIRLMAEKDAVQAKKAGIRMVSWRDAEYPPLLREIFDPPALLFYRGALPDPEKATVAIVGTRKPTPRAAERAFSLGQEFGEAGIPVVSGLALGIDAMAHRGNIQGRGATVAVLGSGADMVYPSSNRDLARRILESGGAIISEYPPGTRPLKGHFPARNRIISGLSRGTVIVEAPEKSGALITAQFALDEDRDLWIDTFGVSSPRGAGTARLAGEGAKVISSARDILVEWNIAVPEKREDAVQSNGGGLASSMAEYLNINL